MRLARIDGADPIPLGAPRDWNRERHGHCGDLFVRREVIDGVGFMRSAWETDIGENLQLLAGGRPILGVAGSAHPVVHMEVQGAPSDAPPTYAAQRVARPGGEFARVDAIYPAGGHRVWAEVVIWRGFGMAVAEAIGRCDDHARSEGWIS